MLKYFDIYLFEDEESKERFYGNLNNNVFLKFYWWVLWMRLVKFCGFMKFGIQNFLLNFIEGYCIMCNE